MAFVLETLTDDQREEQGFARTMDDADAGRGMQFVSNWAIDREQNAKVICISIGRGENWKLELHWNYDTILIEAHAERKSRYPLENETGDYKIDVLFEIEELSIPERLKNQLEEIKDLIIRGLEVYCYGLKDYNGKGYTTFLPNMKILCPEQPKSAVKLAGFQISQ